MFKIALSLRDWYVFTWQPLEILNLFIILTLKLVFWNWFFEKLEYCYLVGSTAMENTTFPCKTGLSKANAKTSRMRSTGVLSLTTLFFWKFNFGIRTFYKKLIQYTNYPSINIHTARKRLSFIRECVLPVSILKENHLPLMTVSWRLAL